MMSVKKIIIKELDLFNDRSVLGFRMFLQITDYSYCGPAILLQM